MTLALFCESNLPYTDEIIDTIESMDVYDEIDWIMIPKWHKNPEWLKDYLEKTSFPLDTATKADFFASDEVVYYGNADQARKLFSGKDFKVHVITPKF